jgi:hypothetical protein
MTPFEYVLIFFIGGVTSHQWSRMSAPWRVRFWASEDLVKRLGNQRVIPQPADSVLNNSGIENSFAAAAPPLTVQFSLEATGSAFREKRRFTWGSS